MLSSIKFALRSLSKSPGFTAVVILIFALGIGANTAIFSLFHQFVLRPLPVPEPDRLVNLSAPGFNPGNYMDDVSGAGAETHFSYPMFRDLERVQNVFTGVAAHKTFQANLGYRSQVKSSAGLFVSGSYFPVLGKRPTLGRLIGPADDARMGAAPVAVLSYDCWQSRFSGNRNILNDTIIVNGQPLTVVGVAPRGFTGTALGAKPQVFVPLTMMWTLNAKHVASRFSPDNRQGYWLNLFARLKPGISMEQARAQLNVPYRAIISDVEARQSSLTAQQLAQFRAKEIALEKGSYGRSQIRKIVDAPIMLLLGMTTLVLLIACANIANLLLARMAPRTGEIALRVSLGATPGRIMAQSLTESCLLAVCGAILGLAFARWTIAIATQFLPEHFFNTFSIPLDGTVLSFTAALALGTGVLCGLLPALRSLRTDLLSAVKGGAALPSGGRGGTRLRGSLIAIQTVMAMVLLVSGGMLLKSLSNISRVDLGLKVDSLVTFRVSPELNGYSLERAQVLFERLEDELASLPGVSRVTAAFMPIIGGGYMMNGIALSGFENVPERQTLARYNKIGPGYFSTLGIPLIAGREFVRSDASGTGPVAIINESLARKLELGGDAVGQWIAPNIQIVGVVKDSKYNDLKEDTPPQYFLPHRQDGTTGALSFYVRAAMPPEQLISQVAKTVTRLDPNLPIEYPKTLAQQIDDNVFLDRLMSTLCTAFAALATLLAAIGLYGMLAYAVARRTKEIGVRIALGAQPRGVAWPIVRDALRLAGIGIGVGGLIALGFARLIRHILFGVEPNDPAPMMGAALLLLAIAGLAAWIPAWRASKVDPLIALRAQ